MPSLPDTSRQNQSSSLPSKRPNALALQESPENKGKLDGLILGCFTVQKLYGRDPGSIEAVNHIFHSTLGHFPADKVIRAFHTWLERSQEFPTPADIVALVKRNGKPPLSEAQFIAISKKDGADRTPDDWQYLRDWQQEREGGWDNGEDEAKESATRAEILRLRQEVKMLRDENARILEQSRQVAISKGLEKPKPSEQEQIARTVEAMKAAGAPQENIDEFLAQFALTDQPKVTPNEQ